MPITTPSASPTRFAPSLERFAAGNGLLRVGSTGQSVLDLQKALRALGHPIDADGVFGPETERAVKAFQRSHGLFRDGVVGKETAGHLRELLSPDRGDGVDPARRGAQAVRAPTEAQRAARPDGSIRAADLQRPAPVRTSTPSGGDNRTAVIEATSQTGQRNQLATGTITINGTPYQFRSGGYGRGNLPRGDYEITPHQWSRRDRSMSVDGVGYSFAMSDRYDPRVGATRTLLRIHPDGGVPGTLGCIGIVGDAATQRRFLADMRAELQRSGGRFTLSVQ
jgi:peptidoglycan hydrolase-like protein with peptidoglycan-binding domain